jgi:hypothetical protein
VQVGALTIAQSERSHSVPTNAGLPRCGAERADVRDREELDEGAALQDAVTVDLDSHLRESVRGIDDVPCWIAKSDSGRWVRDQQVREYGEALDEIESEALGTGNRNGSAYGRFGIWALWLTATRWSAW